MSKPRIININFFCPPGGKQKQQFNLDKPWRLFRSAFLGAFEDYHTWEEAMTRLEGKKGT